MCHLDHFIEMAPARRDSFYIYLNHFLRFITGSHFCTMFFPCACMPMADKAIL